MSQDNWPKKPMRPPAFVGVDGIRVQKAVQGGEIAHHITLRKRMLVDGERTYTAYSANELLEIEAQSEQGRPGHLY